MKRADGLRRTGAATRARIEEEALRLFAAKGVDGTSVKDIGQAVGVTDAALYRHFRSKDEIALSLFRERLAALAGDVRRIGSLDAPFAATARMLIDFFCDLFDSEPHAFRFILMNQHVHLGALADEENVVAALAAIMRRAGERGEIVVTDADLAAAIALGAVVQPATFKLYGRLQGPLAGRAETIARCVIDALARQG
jgi:AcrR family transcriptional regulator